MLKRKLNALTITALFFASQLTFVTPTFAETTPYSTPSTLSNARYQQDAESIKQTFESQLYTLNATTAGHYGLRLFRQTLDPKYSAAIWSDMARAASTLNQIATEIQTPKQAKAYGENRLKAYANTEKVRRQMRFEATKDHPEYLFLGIDLLGSMARADEYGLKHKYDKHLRNLIRQFDFKTYATDPDMIKAWAAQLANQVYWLRQLGEQDVVNEFIETFKKTYPDNQDKQLTDQQFANKIYGLTHIIFAASEYYQHPVDAKEFAWIYDYFDNNIEQILTRTKEDVIAEVGISYLLAQKYRAPTLADTQATIAHAIDPKMKMIPSTDGDFELASGEHRNVLAIMLLHWQGTHEAPTITDQPSLFKDLPYGLIKK